MNNKVLTILVLGVLFLVSCNVTKKTTHIKKFGAIGNGISDDSLALQKAINSCQHTLFLEPKIYLVTKTLILKSNIKIIGNGATLIIPDNISFHIFQINNLKNVFISKVNFVGNRNTIKKGNEYFNYYPIKINNSLDIQMEELSFENFFTSCIQSYSTSNLNIIGCSFTNIGLSTEEYEQKYAYSGIFIGGKKESRNIKILDCKFKNIGLHENEEHHDKKIVKYTNDGNGIQVLMQKNGIMSDIEINNCLFEKCARRGIKIQTGKTIKIKKNNFIKCRAGIGLVMVKPIRNIQIEENTFSRCTQAISPNSSHILKVSSVTIKKNKANNISYFLRTNGKSQLKNCLIVNNKVDSTFLCFLEGKFTNTIIKNNSVNNFALGQDKSYYMSILIVENSHNVKLSDNYLSTSKNTNCAIYVQKKTTDINISNNDIYIPHSKKANRKIIYFNDQTRMNRYEIKNNKLNNQLLKTTHN